MADSDPTPARWLLWLLVIVSFGALVLAILMVVRPSSAAVGSYALASGANAAVLLRALWPWALALNLLSGIATELLAGTRLGRAQASLFASALVAIVPIVAVTRTAGHALFVGLPHDSPAAFVPFIALFVAALVVAALVADTSGRPTATLGCLASCAALVLVAFGLFPTRFGVLPIDIRVIGVLVGYVFVVLAPQVLVSKMGARWRSAWGRAARLLCELGLAAVMLLAFCLVAGSVMVYAGL